MMDPVRVFAAGFGVEVNSFSPLPTDRRNLEQLWWCPAGSLDRTASCPLGAPHMESLWAREDAGEVVLHQGLCAGAQPSGPLSQQAYEDVRSILLEDLRQAGPIDAVVMSLHGATVAHGYDDVDGDLLAAVRDAVGPDVVIGALLDPHCHLTALMLASADLLVAYKEYPHTDIFPAAEKLTGLCLAAARGEIAPVMRAFDCRQISVMHTTREPAKAVIAEMTRMEAEDEGLLDISIAQGFPWGDVADMGMRVWAIADGDPALAAGASDRIGRRLVSLRGQMQSPMLSAQAAVDALAGLPPGPVVLADHADNPGGGAPSDGTQLVSRLLASGVDNIAVGLIWDPGAVAICRAAGLGARLSLRVGGKVCRFSGAPLDLEVEVVAIRDDLALPFGGGHWPVGTAVSVRAGGLEIVLSSDRVQCFDRRAFEAMGIDLTAKRAIVVKSGHHFYTSFSQLTDQILYVDQHGVLTNDYASLPYVQVQRPIWPLDPDATPGPLS